MNILFVHQNFPGQYPHLARHLAADPANRVVAICQRKDSNLRGVDKRLYAPRRPITPNVHHYLRGIEAGVLNAQAVASVALDLKRSGFVPDVMLGHNGWGEIWYLKDVFPTTPLIGYFEFFYRAEGADVGFDPTEALSFDALPRVRTRNLGNLMGLDTCDLGQCPTQWQHSRYPERYRPMLRVMHEGIDTDLVCPDPTATLAIQVGETSDSVVFNAGDEIVTYVARNLEPYRGFPSFMRSLPAILAARPKARVLIVGGDEVSYGAKPKDGRTWRQQLLAELGGSLDPDRVYFLGKVPYATFLKILQVSAAHVYLTYPFVLSWSMLEAMAAGCLLIGSDTAPVREVIRDDENGRLVDFFRPEAIADAVIDVLANPGEHMQLRQYARQTVVENYDLQRVCLPRQMNLLKEWVPTHAVSTAE